MHDFLAEFPEVRVERFVGTWQRRGHPLGQPLRCPASPPPERRLAGRIGRRDDQPTYQAEIGQEVLALPGLDLRVALSPEHVRPEVGRQHREGKRRRRDRFDRHRRLRGM